MFLYSLYPEMSKSFVSFSHTVCIFFFFKSSTFTFACSNNFICQFISHAATVSFAAVADQPFHA